jgi:GT2 family glycosyltransferase
VTVAVVIPSRNRATSLSRLLDALAQQTHGDLEVAVVLDGSTDGSTRMLATRRDPFPLTWIDQRHRGAAAARNAGVACTTAPVVLFLDDDVVPEPQCVARHLAHHGRDRVAVVGDCPIVLPDRPRPHDLSSWGWWVDFNHRRARSAQRRTHRDVCAGNLSIARADLVAVGGFDEAFDGYGFEDWELGVRLLAAGIEVVVEPAAVAHHHRRHTPGTLLAHARSEGRAEVRFARRHPELLSTLRLPHLPDGAVGAAARRAFHRPDRAGIAVRAGAARLVPMRPLRRWWTRFDEQRTVAFWRGVAEELGSWRAYCDLVDGVPPASVSVDVAGGVPAAVVVPEGVPCDVRVTWAGEDVGVVRLPAWLPRDRATLADRISRELAGSLLVRLEA